MAIARIVTGADQEVLCTKAPKVTSFGKDLKRLIEDLMDTVVHEEGAGLAAVQIGVPLSVCVARIGGIFIPLINPEIIWSSDSAKEGEEGCLSLPKVWLYIPRNTEIIVRYLDEKGKEQERKLAGWDARVVQHEVDHLNGKLIVDYNAESAGEKGEAL